MAQPRGDDGTEYHIITTKNESDHVADNAAERDGTFEAYTPSLMNRSWTSTLVLQTLAVLWLLPIAALFWLNGREYKIGASAWCPRGDCEINMFKWDATQRRLELAEHDRNVVGGLQFVAKALEVWFVFVAAALLYLVTMGFASRHDGLPIGYLTKSVNFATPVGLADALPLIGRGATSKTKLGPRTARRRGIWLLALLSVTLFVLRNLMGPATQTLGKTCRLRLWAVLVLPVLQWVDNPVQDVQKITRINYDIPPQSTIESWFYRSTEECNATRYDKLMFSCTQQPYGDSLDSWLENYQVTNGLRSMATESFMTFEMNRTEAVESDEGLSPKHVDALLASWVPSRQVIASLNEDLQFVEDSAGNPSAEGERYDLNSRTLGLELRRNGPILGAITGRYLDYAPWPGKFIINVDQKRTVICYRGYDFRWVSGELLTNFTKCTRNGGGWNASLSEDATTWRKFFIAGRGGSGPPATATIISSDKTVFLPNGEIPDWFDPACLDVGSPNSTIISCDWERFFDYDPEPRTQGRRENMVTIEYYLPSDVASNRTADSSAVLLAVDFAAYLGSTEYSVNTSPTENPARLVRTEKLPEEESIKPIFVEPTWVLAGWAADDQGYVNPYRPTANLLMFVLEQLLAHQDKGFALFDNDIGLDAITTLPIMQTLSLIDHTVEPWFGPVSKIKDPGQQDLLLYSRTRMFLWAYGFNSRTARFRAAVAGAGCIVVLLQVVLGFIDRRRYRTPTQLLVAALEHVPQGEFAGRPHKESALAAAEFRVLDNASRGWKA